MEEVINFFADWGDINVGVLLALIPFSAVVSLFHSLILRGLCDWKYRPKWLLIALEPVFLFLLWVIKPNVVIFAFVILVALTVVLAIVGFFIMPLVMKLKETKVEYQQSGKKITAFTVGKITGRYVLGIIAVLVIMLTQGASLPLIFLLMFIILPLFVLKNPGGDRRFMRLQATLPTSPIRSVAMGLAEVEGNVVMKESLSAPIGDIKCAAYQYEIQEKEHSSEGRTSYTTIHSENKCNIFSIQDKTGVLDVTPEKLNLLCLPINQQYEKGGKRYTQRLLLPGDRVLLIGMADTGGGQTVFRYEKVKKVYALMPSQVLNKYNKARPLINNLVLYTSVFGIIASLILLFHIEYDGGKLHITPHLANKNIQEKTIILKHQ